MKKNESPREPQIESGAFLQTQLKSERIRVLVLLLSVLAIFLLSAIRTLAFHAHEDRGHLLVKVVFLSFFLVYEVAMLRAVNRALGGGRGLTSFAWVADTIVETSLPAMGLAFLTASIIEPAYRPLANPLVLTYFLFIILSVLRLNVWASVLSGALAAGSYLCASYFLGWRPFIYPHASIQSPQRSVFSYSLEFLVAGAVAGAVAREVRKYVRAALREAETRRQMERLEHDMQVARSIQQSLLPNHTPAVKGFEVAGWNLAADETGGDFYDWQQFPNGNLAVVLADVTGHGLGPAMLAAACRAYARASLSIQDDLLTAMGRINAALSQDLTAGRFVTLVAAVCSPESSRVGLLSAGHGPLFVYLLREDRMEIMGAQGLPLGIVPDLRSDPPLSLDLNPGDLLLLATDGLYEWENAMGEQFGPKRIEQTIRQVRECRPQEIIKELYRAVLEFSGGTTQQDDLTLVVIKQTQRTVSTRQCET